MINMIKLESDDIKLLIKARIEFDKRLRENPIEKDARGNRGAYVSLESLQEKTGAIMSPLGLCMEQTTLPSNGKEYLITTLRHESGQFIRSIGYLYKEEEEMDGELAKLCGAIMTYKQRYQWRAILCIGRGSEDIEDVDTAKNSYKSTQSTIKNSSKILNTQEKTLASFNKITQDQAKAILSLTEQHGGLQDALCKSLKVDSIYNILAKDYVVAYDTAHKMLKLLNNSL